MGNRMHKGSPGAQSPCKKGELPPQTAHSLPTSLLGQISALAGTTAFLFLYPQYLT